MFAKSAAVACASDRAASTVRRTRAPDVWLPGGVNRRQLIISVGYRSRRPERRLVLRLARAAGGSIRCDGGKICSTNGADRGSCFEELRLFRFQRFVRDADLLFERVELRIAINFPPLSLGDSVAWLRGLPICGFLVIGRRRRLSAERSSVRPCSRRAGARQCPALPPGDCASLSEPRQNQRVAMGLFLCVRDFPNGVRAVIRHHQ